jgi:hypothetical protein
MIWTLLILAACLAGTGWLAWISIQSYRQGRLLGALPRGIVGSLEGQSLAAHGRVRVNRPVHVEGVGPCLWFRNIEKELAPYNWGFGSRRRDWRTVSDQVSMGDFFLVFDGQEIEIEALPTEIQGTLTKKSSEMADWFGQLTTERSYLQILEWLPLLEELTVVGRLERRESRRVLVADPQLGLLLSPHPPDKAARIEMLKAIGGFVGVILGCGLTFWIFQRFLTRS